MKTAKYLLLLLLASSALGCAPRYLPLASHTPMTAENQETDVVWVTEEQATVKRCSNTAQGPVCVTAKQQ